MQLFVSQKGKAKIRKKMELFRFWWHFLQKQAELWLFDKLCGVRFRLATNYTKLRVVQIPILRLYAVFATQRHL